MSDKLKYTYPEKLSILRFFRDAEGVRRNPIPFHKKYFGTASMRLVIVGDTEGANLNNSLKKAFKNWNGGVAEKLKFEEAIFPFTDFSNCIRTRQTRGDLHGRNQKN